MSLQPLRRNPALVPLSHDHHDGLMAAVRLKKEKPAYRDETDPLVSIKRLWRDELRPHFEQEERVLFSRQWPAEVTVMVDQALDEHRQIRAIVERVEAGNATSADVRELGELLERHIRFEERQLFGALQDALSAAEMTAVGEQIAGMRDPKFCRIDPSKKL
jgi:hypothetical protein